MGTEKINGIINILKPPGMTSFDVVASLRRVFKTKKIGHTGTLDPGVAGVLPICIGNATKAIEFITEKDKLYRAELTLGVETDTQDSTGEITRVREVKINKQQITDAILGFVGEYSQIPPMYSAVKVDGKKLYDLARSGVTIERKPREVRIHYINIIDIKNSNRILFDVACSKGTYIRTLCADIGECLGCGGHMSFLVRLKSGPFDIDSAVTFEDIAGMALDDVIKEKLSQVDEVFKDLNKIILNSADEKRLLNGVSVKLYNISPGEGRLIRVYNSQGEFFALGEVVLSEESFVLRSKKLFLS